MVRRARRQRLNIWTNGEHVGVWEQIAGAQDSLSYAQTWLSHAQGRPLSLSMPFRAGGVPYRGDVVANFFDNLLPDSENIRRRLAQHHRADGVTPFSLLRALGRDCAGALQILPEDESPEGIHQIDGKPLDEARVAALLRRAANAPGPGRDEHADDLRWSIAGAQEKTALSWHGGRWLLPAGSTPTTHILKLPLGRVGNARADMRSSVENEWLCAWLAAAYGLAVAPCGIGRFEDQKVLVVERFDRKLASDGKWIVRLPQEDFCQATGTSPLHKYQADGGPGIAEIMTILAGSTHALQDREHFFKTQIFFWLLAAPDGHAKNFSIALLPRGAYRATPLYDILSAHPVIGTGKAQIAPQKIKLAMAVRSVGNHYRIQEIQWRHWIAQGRQVGLDESIVARIIDELLGATEAVLEAAAVALPNDYPLDVAESIFEGIRAQARRLAAQGLR
jgi:serine/threonine-protein kinase HipA